MSASPELDEIIDVPVLVVGGSLVGLATAMFLAQHGVDVLSVERHHGTAIRPRAGHFHLRTLELMRVAGIEDRVRAAALALYSPDGGINAVETLAGRGVAASAGQQTLMAPASRSAKSIAIRAAPSIMGAVASPCKAAPALSVS
jgi:glycine/D-amino acid oxidase-like deaminating enzyme